MSIKQELAETRKQLAQATAARDMACDVCEKLISELEATRAERDALVDALIGSLVTNDGLSEDWSWETADFMGHGHPTRDEAVAALMAHVMQNPKSYT